MPTARTERPTVHAGTDFHLDGLLQKRNGAVDETAVLFNAIQYSLDLHPVLNSSVDGVVVTPIIPSRERDARTESVGNAGSVLPASLVRARPLPKPTLLFAFSIDSTNEISF